MRLLRLRLRDFRGTADLEVPFAARGVTLVEGPNEAGKTSLLEAFALVRELPDSSRAARVLAVRPVGSDVGPSVEVELETGPYRLVLAKRWLRSPSTELRVLAPRPEQLSGRAAHDRFVAILDETLDRQVLHALQLVQGEGLDQPDLAHVEPLHAALVAGTHAPVDVEAEVDGHDPLVAAVTAELGRYRTPRTGRPRAELSAATDAESAAGERVHRLATELADARTLADRHEAARGALPSHRERFASATTRHAEAVAAGRALDVAREAARDAHERLDKATRQLLDAERARQTRARLVADVAERALVVDGARDELEPATRAADRAGSAAEAAGTAYDTARGRLDLAEQVHARARRRADVLDARERVEVLTRRTARVRTVLAEEEQARAALRARPFPAEALAEVERSAREVEVAERARLAAATTIELERVDDGTDVRVDGSSVPASWTSAVLRPTTVDVPGARLVLRPGEAAGLDEELTAARQRLDGALVRHAVDDVEAARAARAEHERREGVLASAGQALAVVLDGAAADTLLAELEDASARLERCEQEAAADPADGIPGTVDELREAADDARLASDAARDARDDAREAAHVAARRLVGLQHAAESAAHELTRARTTLSRARAVGSDDDLAAALEEARRENDEQRAAAEEAAASLARLQALGLDEARAAAAQALETAAHGLREAEDTTVALAARLDAARERGTWEEHDAAVADHERAARVLAEVGARAEAAALLLERLTSRREAARASYVRPFTRALDTLGERVFGPGFGVEVTPALRIASRTLDGRTVPFDQLSAGAREQLGILGRLACASLVSPDAGAPVVLDDALGFADPERLAALTHVIETAGQDAQVVVLTCQPDRYAGLEPARTVRLTR